MDCIFLKSLLYYLYMQDSLNKLIYIAMRRMKRSNDPIHDFNHVSRVVEYTRKISEKMNLTTQQRQALVLAAWWHDVGRTVFKKPSLFLASAVDDIISAVMMVFFIVTRGLYGRSIGMAVKIIFCKSIGAGALLTRFLFRKKNRILVDIVRDADSIDMLDQERSINLMRLIENSKLYRLSYKASVIWSLRLAELHIKTEAAKLFLRDMLISFLKWLKEKNIFDWYVKQFGLKWVLKILSQIEDLLIFMNNKVLLSQTV